MGRSLIDRITNRDKLEQYETAVSGFETKIGVLVDEIDLLRGKVSKLMPEPTIIVKGGEAAIE